MKKYCYVTLATNQTYLLGAKFLANFLKKTKTKYPIVLLTIENLKKTFRKMRNVFRFVLNS